MYFATPSVPGGLRGRRACNEAISVVKKHKMAFWPEFPPLAAASPQSASHVLKALQARARVTPVKVVREERYVIFTRHLFKGSLHWRRLPVHQLHFNMSTAATTSAPKSAKAKKPDASKKASDHPKYLDMTKDAIAALKERNGSSRQAILKYIMANYKVGNDQKPVNSRLKTALRNGANSGVLKRVGKGTGATGSFKLAEKAKVAKAVKPKKAKAPKTPKKASSAKKSTADAKKKSPKKTAKKPAAAAKKPKAAAKQASPKKAAKKPAAKKAKTPKKAAAKKSPAKKPAAKKTAKK